MAQQAARRNFPNQPKKKRIVIEDSRTKFDLWLDDHVRTGEIVRLVFKQDPFGLEPGLISHNVKIFTVDRYNIFVEFVTMDETFWVSKENILSAQ